MSASGEPGPARTRVAIVNPQPLFTEVLRKALDGTDDIDVVADVTDPSKAADVLAQAEPNLVLFVVIGEAQDVGTMNEIATRLPDSPLLVLAHSPAPQSVAASYEAGASGYFTLATPLNELIEIVRSTGATGTASRQRARGSSSGRKNHVTDPGHFLTDREVEVLRRFTHGMPTRAIATELGISVSTVRTHIQNILTKLGVHSKLEAAAYAARNNLT